MTESEGSANKVRFGFQSGVFKVERFDEIVGQWVDPLNSSKLEVKSAIHITGSQPFGNSHLSLQCDNDILCNELKVNSSKTIKRVIDSSKDFYESVVNTIRSLQFSKYTYKDTVQFGECAYYGVIAEEVFQLCPEIVSSTQRFIPDIYRIAKIQDLGQSEHSRSQGLRLQFDDTLADFYQLFDQDDKLTKPIGNRVKLVYNMNGSASISQPRILNLGEDYLIIEASDVKYPDDVFVYGTIQTVMAVAKDRLMEQGLITIQYILEKLDAIQNIDTPHQQKNTNIEAELTDQFMQQFKIEIGDTVKESVIDTVKESVIDAVKESVVDDAKKTFDKVTRRIDDHEQTLIDIKESYKQSEQALTTRLSNYDNVIQKLLEDNKQLTQVVSQLQQQIQKKANEFEDAPQPTKKEKGRGRGK